MKQDFFYWCHTLTTLEYIGVILIFGLFLAALSFALALFAARAWHSALNTHKEQENKTKPIVKRGRRKVA